MQGQTRRMSCLADVPPWQPVFNIAAFTKGGITREKKQTFKLDPSGTCRHVWNVHFYSFSPLSLHLLMSSVWGFWIDKTFNSPGFNKNCTGAWILQRFLKIFLNIPEYFWRGSLRGSQGLLGILGDPWGFLVIFKDSDISFGGFFGLCWEF